MIALGMGIGASAMVGKSIGENNIDKAIKYAKISVMLGFVIAFFNMVVTVTFRKYITMAYTSDETLLDLV